MSIIIGKCFRIVLLSPSFKDFSIKIFLRNKGTLWVHISKLPLDFRKLLAIICRCQKNFYVRKKRQGKKINRDHASKKKNGTTSFYNMKFLRFFLKQHQIFSSNRNIHKSLCGLCFWASDPWIDRFWKNLSIKGTKAQKQRPRKLLPMLWFDEKRYI